MTEVLNLRILADDYEQAQRRRVARGEQIRAIVQGHDQQEGGVYLSGLGFLPVVRPPKTPDDEPVEVKSAADLLLEAIKRGDTDEPSSYLARTYRQDWERERLAFSEMGGVLESHPAWEWMRQIRGVGPTLGAKLLSRLDLDLANNSSSFMAYCGLGTVPGQRWECGECGWVGIFPKTHKVTGKHKGKTKEEGKTCKTLAVCTHVNPEGVHRNDMSDEDQSPFEGILFADIRAAQPRAEKGQKRSYDAFAKKTMYLLAVSFLKAGPRSYYGKVYREKRAFYETQRPGWDDARSHFAALRTAEKVFLSNLYEAWCKAEGRTPVDPYVKTELGHEVVTAEEVLEWEAAKRE